MQQFGAAVLLQGPALLDAYSLIVRGIRQVTQQDGIAAPSRLTELQRCLAGAVEEYRASVSPSGRGDVRELDDRPESGTGPDDHLTTREAAAVLHISERHMRRLSDDVGGSVRRGGVLLYDRAAVEALAATRTPEEGAR